MINDTLNAVKAVWYILLENFKKILIFCILRQG